MSNERPGPRRDDSPTPRRCETVTAAVATALASVAPVAIGSWTLTSGMSNVPFNGSLAVFIVVWVATILRLHEARTIDREEELVHKLQSEISDSHAARIAASVDRADQRAANVSRIRRI